MNTRKTRLARARSLMRDYQRLFDALCPGGTRAEIDQAEAQCDSMAAYRMMACAHIDAARGMPDTPAERRFCYALLGIIVAALVGLGFVVWRMLS